MKLNTELNHDAEYIGNIQENRVGIDRNNIDFITTLLTSNLYSQPLESFLRETVSNAYDSHVEAGTQEHILLLIEDTSVYTYRISIRDYGTGVSPERFDKIYKNIGSSTKRDSNDYIGMFGIGRFSCLSCTDTATINSYYNGVKDSYIMYKNGGGINIDKVSSIKGEFKNGLEISIELYVPDTSSFIKSIYKLALFDKLYVTYKGSSHSLKEATQLFNDREVKHFKHFSTCSLSRFLSSFNYFRVGNVLYPNKTHPLFSSGIIINLPVGSVDITPNRENLQFTNYTETTIKNQEKLVKEELQSIVDAHIKSDMSLCDFFRNYIYRPFIEISGLNIDLRDVSMDFSDTTIDQEHMPLNLYNYLKAVRYYEIPKEFISGIINNGVSSRFGKQLQYIFLGKYALINKKDKATKNVTLLYATENLKQSAAIIIRGEDFAELSSRLSDFCKNWDTSSTYNFNPEECFNFIIKHLPVIEMANSSVPESFITEYKESRKNARKDLKSEDVGYTSVRSYNGNGYTLNILKDLPSKGLIIYTSHTQSGEDKCIKDLAKLLYPISGIGAVITLSKTNLHIVQGNKRFVTIEDFLYLKNRVLCDLVTCYIIQHIFYSDPMFEGKNLPIYREFTNKYRGEHLSLRYLVPNTVLSGIVSYYTEKGWINQADIKYYTLTNKEIDALVDFNYMMEHRIDVVCSLAYRQYGSMRKIGLTPVKNPLNIKYK